MESFFRPAKEKKTEASCCDKRNFGLLVRWLHTNSITTASQTTMLDVAHLWFLADCFLMAALQQATVHTLKVLITPNVAPTAEILELIAEVYGEHPKHTQSLHGVLIAHVSTTLTDHFDVWMDGIPNEMVKDCARYIKQRIQDCETTMSNLRLQSDHQRRSCSYYLSPYRVFVTGP